MSEDLIRRSDAIEAIEAVDWYHQNRNKDMVSGANPDEHQAWYKADDVYKALEAIQSAPSIDICFCKECKHKPIKEDADGEDYGFNVIAPNEDERCPCLVEDGWYSWIPKDDFYCGYGERKGE